MERKSSIVLQHNKNVVVGYFLHNSREKPTVNSIFDINDNFTNIGGQQSIQMFWNELNKRIKKYTTRTGKKLPSNTIKHISSIMNIKKTTTKQDIEKVIQHLEKTLDTKVIQYSIHKDEGHIDENGNKKINYHCHLEMVGLDSNGNSIRKKITRKYLINLQTEISKILKMERGKSVKETKKKRLDTYQYKQHKKLEQEKIKELEKENQELKKENQELKKENQDLKKEIKSYIRLTKDIRNYIKTINKGLNIFIKEDYDELSKIQKELIKKI